jgi:hypothetical protein
MAGRELRPMMPYAGRILNFHSRGGIEMRNHRAGFAWAAALGGLMMMSLSSQAQTQQDKMKECAAEWKAMKAANKTKGIKFRDFERECLAKGAAPPAATTPPATKPAAAAPATAPPAATTAPAPKAAAKPAAAPSASNEFATEAAAKARCSTDTVVWVNLDSKIYHYTGYSDYGKTKRGAYMCEKDTSAAGFRAAKNEKRP